MMFFIVSAPRFAGAIKAAAMTAAKRAAREMPCFI
jgi:hypothetical protein